MSAPANARIGTRRVVALLIGYAFLWYVLTDGDVASWVVGAPTVLAAAAVGLAQRGTHWRLSLLGAIRFAVFFLVESIKGGLDVAGRVVHSRVRIAPALLDYETSLLREPSARDFFVLCVSLLPGTLVASIDDHHLVVHVLDAAAPARQDLARLERVVAGLFGVDLASESGERS
jgi:multicomponent Na+:H+ antiporter subunit E